jgi:hypothetical protein
MFYCTSLSTGIRDEIRILKGDTRTVATEKTAREYILTMTIKMLK